MKNQFKGTIYKVDEIRQVSEKFQVRTFILEERYPTRFGEQVNYGKFQLTQEKCNMIDVYKHGDEVIVDFNVNGGLFQKEDGTEECFPNLDVYSMAPATQGDVAENTTTQTQESPKQPPPGPPVQENSGFPTADSAPPLQKGDSGDPLNDLPF